MNEKYTCTKDDNIDIPYLRSIPEPSIVMKRQQLAIDFMKNQTLSNLQLMKNEGMDLYQLKNNKFEVMHEYTLPLKTERFVTIYEKVNSQAIQPIGVAVY